MKSFIKYVYLSLRKLFFDCLKLFFFSKTFDKTKIKKILVIRIDRIGDVVLSLPVLREIKKELPTSELYFMVSSDTSYLVRENPYIERIIIYDKNWNLLKKIKFIYELRKEKFNLVIDLIFDYTLRTSIMTFFTFADYKVGYDIYGRGIFYNVRVKPPKEKMHVLEYNFYLLEYLGLKSLNKNLELFISEKVRKETEQFLYSKKIEKRNYIVVHPGGYYLTQRWPLEKFIKVIEHIIKKYNYYIIVIGNNKEKDIIDSIIKFLPQEIQSKVILLSDIPLDFLASLIKESKLFLGNNSGPLHIATAVKVPTVSTMGPTDPVVWWPVGENNIVLRKNLFCSPCKKKYCKDHTCMKEISVNEIIASIDKLINF